jgi:hypothetical protein
MRKTLAEEKACKNRRPHDRGIVSTGAWHGTVIANLDDGNVLLGFPSARDVKVSIIARGNISEALTGAK